MDMNRIFFMLCICLSVNATAQTTRTIPFGKGNRIVYDLNTGNYTVQSQGKDVITNATAVFEDAASPAKRTLQSQSVHDALGDGMKYTITNGSHQHIIYTYKNLNGFVTMTAQQGGTSRMSPLTGEFKPKGEGVVVPFDNDAWIRYKMAESDFTSSEVTAFEGLVIGSLEQRDWKTGIRVNRSRIEVIAGWTDNNITRDAAKHGVVESGRSPRILVLLESDWRKGLEQYAKLQRLAEPRYVQNRKGSKPFGWNSWGSMQTNISLEKVNKVTDFFADSIKAFRNADNTAFIDLDSYWDKLNFEQLKTFADHCKARKLKAGIYWAPFVDWGKSPRKMEGSEYNYADVWTKANGNYHDFDGCRALDPTHPATKARIAYLIKKFKECGFEMIKIDFIGHAAIEADRFYDPKVRTGMQAFRQGMEFLSDQLQKGSPMLVYAAISPNIATARYVHMRRIACDAFKSLKDTDYTLNGTSMGWWQQYIYDYIDADHVVFDGETPAVNRARLLSALVTGSVVLGDDLSVPTNAQSILRSFVENKALMEALRDTAKYRPVDIAAGYAFKSSRYLVIINTTDKESQYFVGRKVQNLFATEGIKQMETVHVPAGDAAIYRIFQ